MWFLKRVHQCDKCPWRKDCDPHAIPNGYSVEQHKALEKTIASAFNVGQTLHIMTCHETDRAHCVGWLNHQLGIGNNIALRIKIHDCQNADKIKTVGEQHSCFEDTMPNKERNR